MGVGGGCRGNGGRWRMLRRRGGNEWDLDRWLGRGPERWGLGEERIEGPVGVVPIGIGSDAPELEVVGGGAVRPWEGTNAVDSQTHGIMSVHHQRALLSGLWLASSPPRLGARGGGAG